MKRTQLWSVERKNSSFPGVVPVPSVDNTETEAILEDILTHSPDLLMENLAIVGRQVPTEGGPLDLLGVDEDGRMVVFELKRGTLTREAVAQILDYVSDLAEMDSDRLGKLVQDYSGRLGVDKIEDFDDWYSQRFPNSDSPLAETPKAVLVGLGVDDRARRIVTFLANSTIDVQLLTFHAFKNGDQLLLARQVETVASVPRQVRDRPTSQSKESNLQILTEQAASLGVTEFLAQVTNFLKNNFPAYAWPGKTSYTYYLTERTEQGRPTQRAYVSLYLDTKIKNSLKLIFITRATEVAPEALAKLHERFPKITYKNPKTNQVELSLISDQWQALSGELADILTAIVDGWKKKTTTSPSEVNQEAKET